jgi:hypothetical protein
MEFFLSLEAGTQRARDVAGAKPKLFSLQNKQRQVLLVIPYIYDVHCCSLIWSIHFFNSTHAVLFLTAQKLNPWVKWIGISCSILIRVVLNFVSFVKSSKKYNQTSLIYFYILLK